MYHQVHKNGIKHLSSYVRLIQESDIPLHTEHHARMRARTHTHTRYAAASPQITFTILKKL
jgi:hypothetical protein